MPIFLCSPISDTPTVSYTCQHPRILPAFLSCHSKSGQVWPHGVEPFISKLSRRPCNQGQLLPSFLSCMAKGAPKPCGSPSLLAKAVWSFFLPKLCGALPSMAARPRFKPQHQSSSAALFPIPPTISYTCQHYCIFLALLGCSSKSGQVWPCGMERIISKLSHRCCNRQGLGVPSQSHPRWKSLPSLWLKAGPQLFNISMKPVKDYRYVK